MIICELPVRKSRLINDAIKHHKLAININPEYPYPYVNLGRCYFDKGDVDGCIAPCSLLSAPIKIIKH